MYFSARRSLEVVRSEIDVLQSGTTMGRFWSAEKDAGTLKRLQGQVKAALEELQVSSNGVCGMIPVDSSHLLPSFALVAYEHEHFFAR